MITFANSDPTYNAFNEFLKNYGVFLAIGVAAIIAVVVIVLLLKKSANKPEVIKKEYQSSSIFEALGGKENVLSHQKVGSRIVLTLQNYDAVDENKLNELGVDSVIKMSNKITLVTKGDAESLYKLFN